MAVHTRTDGDRNKRDQKTLLKIKIFVDQTNSIITKYQCSALQRLAAALTDSGEKLPFLERVAAE
jgi:hypothetical protein